MNEPLTVRIFGRRRELLVDRSYQHRMSLFTTLLAMLPPGIFFGVYYLITSEGSRRIVEASPGLEPLIRGQDRTENLLILAALMFYGLGVYLVSLMESHRTAGFLWRLNQSVRELREGRYGRIFRPRRDDNFTHLAEMTNGLSHDLKSRVEADLALLDDVSRTLDGYLSATPDAAAPRPERLTELRGRVEAMRALKRSCLADDAPPVPADIPAVFDTTPPASSPGNTANDPLTR
ncbi:MAG: hypothetical protein ACE5IK_11930 [Acidobacteriota bacterium]